MSEDLKKIVKEHVDTIRKTSLFQGLPMGDLVKFLVQCQHNEVTVGDTVFEEGESSTSMVIVLTGEIEIYKDEAKVCTLEPPALIGEIGLFTESPRNATVIVTKDGISLTITQDDLNSFFKREPQLSHKIYRNIILTMRNKINNDNQQILILQEELQGKEDKINELTESIKKHGSFEGDEALIENIKPLADEKKDILPPEDRLSRNDRTNIRVAINNQKHCYLKIGKSTVHVKDLSLGGISIDLNSVKGEERKNFVEGDNLSGEMFLQHGESLPFSGVIRKVVADSCGIQFNKFNYAQENAIIKTVNDLQRIGQVL